MFIFSPSLFRRVWVPSISQESDHAVEGGLRLGPNIPDWRDSASDKLDEGTIGAQL